MYSIYTDGSSLGNPGPGGWGAIICHDTREYLLSGGEVRTTNNVMELTAVIRVLEWLLQQHDIPLPEDMLHMGLFADPSSNTTSATIDEDIHVFTDSTYVQKGVSERLDVRARRQWRRSKGGQLIENVALRQRMWLLLPYFTHLHLERLKGHAGHIMNERVDVLARKAAEQRL